MADSSPLADLPRVDTVVDAAADLVVRHGRGATTAAVRAALDAARSAVRAGAAVPTTTDVVAAAQRLLQARRPGPPRRVINATGVVVHTNLGRAPLSPAAVAAVVDAAGPCDLEVDLDTGGRGARDARVEPYLVDATGAEAAFVVNNAAAALVLALAALALGREVLVSRGELVEIGGSFRLPDVMAASGARLVEVGTTNRTRAVDYLVGDPALLLKVHPSNYRVTGFASAPTVPEVAAVARDRGVPLLFDVGSGLLDAAPVDLGDEPTMAGALRDGADLVVASADKLLGGPQAGLLVGRADLVDRCRRHPLARALRLDKLRIAALVATLDAHVRGAAPQEVPVWAALGADTAALASRSRALADAVRGEVVDGRSLVGGGSAPGVGVPGPVVRVASASPDTVARALRRGDPPVVGRVGDGALWLDLRTVDASDDAVVAQAVTAAAGCPPVP